MRPTLDVNGMWSGYTGEGSKTVLPSFAAAKVSMRLVPDQDPHELFPAFEAYVKALAPPGVTVVVKDLHGAHAVPHRIPIIRCSSARAVRSRARGRSPRR